MIMDTHYRKILWMALVLFSVYVGTAQERVSKTVEKTFPLTNAGELQLENKYGNVTLKGWEQNKVVVNITVTVNHRKKENAKDLLERINPKIKSSNGFISIVSEIDNKNEQKITAEPSNQKYRLVVVVFLFGLHPGYGSDQPHH